MFKTLTQRVLEPPALGLDISDQTLKFCQFVRAGAGFRMKTSGEISLPPDAIREGEIKSEEALQNAIRNGLDGKARGFFGERFCIASLPEEKSFVRMIELPPMPQKDLPHAVRWEVEGAVPLAADEIFYGYELAPRQAGRDRIDVLITAFPRAIIESYQRVLTGAGFRPLVLELESQATSRAVLAPDLLKKSLIIVTLGQTRTHFTMVSDGAIVFTKTIAVGGSDFESAISKRLGVSPEEALALKIEVGFDRSYAEGALAGALEPVLQSITDALTEQIWFFRDHAQRRGSSGDLDLILLSGGDANLIGLEKYIATSVKKPAILADPFANAGLDRTEVPPIPRSESLKYATAIGLALGAFTSA